MKALYFNEDKQEYEQIEISDMASTDTGCDHDFVCANCTKKLTPYAEKNLSLVIKDFDGNRYQVCRVCRINEKRRLTQKEYEYKLNH